MGIDQSVAFKRDRLPTVVQLVDQAQQWGFDLSLDDVDFAEFVGILPGKLNGKDAGFDFCIDPIDEFDWLAEVYETPLEELVGDRDVVATFRTQSGEFDTQCAMIAAAAWLFLADGLYFDDFDNMFDTPEILVSEVREWLAGEVS